MSAAEDGGRNGSSTVPAPRGALTQTLFVLVMVVLIVIGLLVAVTRLLIKAVTR